MDESKDNPLLPWLAAFVIIAFFEGAVIAYLVFGDRFNTSESTEGPVAGSTLNLSGQQPTSVTPTLAPRSVKQVINRTFQFPVNNPDGSVGGIVNYHLKDYEFTNQVVVNKLYKALVTGDNEILALNIEITNDNDYAVQMMSGDYIRLTKNSEDKLVAPDIENDPVEVRPHSTKQVSIGFAVNTSDSNIMLQVGELDGDKEVVNITR